MEISESNDADVSDANFQLFVAGGSLACSFIILFHNVLTIVILFSHKKLQESSIYWCRVCQAITELCVGVIMFIRYISLCPATKFIFDSDEVNCLTLTGAYYICKIESIFCMVLISMDRYVFKVSPILYFRFVNQNTGTLILFTGIISVLFVIIPIMLSMPRSKPLTQCFDLYVEHSGVFIAYMSIIFTALALIVALYLTLYYTYDRGTTVQQVTFKNQSQYFDRRNDAERGTERSESYKGAYFVLFLGFHFVFFICWMHYMVTIFLFYTVNLSRFAVELAINISGLNSICNFYILLVSYPEFRNGLKEVIPNIRHRLCGGQPSTDLRSMGVATRRATSYEGKNLTKSESIEDGTSSINN